MDPDDGDTLFGLRDLGMGFPELGHASLQGLEKLRVPALPGTSVPLPLERDRYFKPSCNLSVYAAAARPVGRVTEDPHDLETAAVAIDSDETA